MAEAAKILEAALGLAPDERARLVEALSASLDGVELNPEWEAELQRRIEDIDTGRVEAVSGEDVFRRIEQRFGGR
jgi:putative addiction module component (TIGR02574 family)